MDNKQFINNLFTEVWTNLDADKISQFYSKDLVAHFGKQKVSYSDIVNRLEFVKNNYKKVTNELEDIIVDGEKVVVRLKQTYEASNSQENKLYAIIGVYQLTNGKVSHLWALTDDQAFDYFN